MVLCQIPTISPSNPGVGQWGMPLIGALCSRHNIENSLHCSNVWFNTESVGEITEVAIVYMQYYHCKRQITAVCVHNIYILTMFNIYSVLYTSAPVELECMHSFYCENKQPSCS